MRSPINMKIYVDLLDKLKKDQSKPEDEVYQFCSPDPETDETKEDEE